MCVLLIVVSACLTLFCEVWWNWSVLVWFGVCGERGSGSGSLRSLFPSTCSGSVQSLISHTKHAQVHWARILHHEFPALRIYSGALPASVLPSHWQKGRLSKSGLPWLSCWDYDEGVLMIPFYSHSPWNLSLGFLLPHPDPLVSAGPSLIWP